MERESFEDETVAEIMNNDFICIKVDREERPDVDQIYMDAIQTMGLQGGWPLNVFLTEDQKPFYGGTYFPRESWLQLLKNVAEAYQNQRAALKESAEKFAESLNSSDLQKYRLGDDSSPIDKAEVKGMFQKLSKSFDKKKGGINKAPKFPMPGIWRFILHYCSITDDTAAKDQLALTLQKMTEGGIYDQVGGGFSRYSVDDAWFAPHFEKMLYDNGQLMSLYAEAYRFYKSDQLKKTVYQTLGWVEREMTSPEGGFYAALDADSEGVEGKFYTWTWNDFERAVGKDSALMGRYYGVTSEGNWEHGVNILHLSHSPEEFAQKEGIALNDLLEKIRETEEKLLSARQKRIRPGLDDKILTGWNGMMLKGLIDAYVAFGANDFLKLALKNAAFIKEKLIVSPNTLCRTYKNGKPSLNGFLEDYASVIQAYTSLYQVTLNEEWLSIAEGLATYVLDNFYDEKERLFFYTDKNSEKLIARKKELFDNVIPSSNSLMAQNLYQLGILLDKEEWQSKAAAMISQVKKLIIAEPQYMNNWALAYLQLAYPTAEIASIGPEAKKTPLEIGKHPLFNVLFAGTEEKSFLPLLKKRTAINEKTTIYVCYGQACQLPVHTVDDAIAQIKIS